jgi:hypothetical protein
MYICYKPARKIEPQIAIKPDYLEEPIVQKKSHETQVRSPVTIKQNHLDEQVKKPKTQQESYEILPQKGLEQRLEESQIVETIDRRKATSPKSYEEVVQLSKQRPHVNKSERKKINKRIRQITSQKRSVPINRDNPTERRYCINFTDLSGKLIGTVYSSPNPDTGLILGETSLVTEFSFDFITLKQGGLCLKATAYLTEQGKDYLRTYVKRGLTYERPDQIRNLGRTKSDVRDFRPIKKLKAKRILKQRNSYEIKVDDAEVHVNLQGKISIFVPNPNLEKKLVDRTDLEPLERDRLERFARYSPCKKWVKHTDQELNQLVTSSLTYLSQIVSRIFERYTSPAYA